VVAGFVDEVMVRLQDPAQLVDLVAPASDPTHERLKRLFAQVYSLPFASLHDVVSVDVDSVEFQRPLFPPKRLAGTWLQTMPNHVQTDVSYEGVDGLTPEWIDLAAYLSVTVILQIDPGEVDSLRVTDLGEFTTIAQFQAKFRFFDVSRFMAEHGFSTADDLKRAFRYLLGEVKLKAPIPFDPSDPANQRRFSLQLAILVRATIDLVLALRDARLAREAVERTLSYRREVNGAEVLTPYAPLLVFAQAAVADTPFSEAQIHDFFARQNILALFITP
jgi:hypothetical protein